MIRYKHVAVAGFVQKDINLAIFSLKEDAVGEKNWEKRSQIRSCDYWVDLREVGKVYNRTIILASESFESLGVSRKSNLFVILQRIKLVHRFFFICTWETECVSGNNMKIQKCFPEIGHQFLIRLEINA